MKPLALRLHLIVLLLLPRAAAASPLDALAVGFEPNRGQAPAGVAFVSTGPGPRVALAADGFAIGAQRVRFAGAHGALSPEDPSGGVANYLVGADPSRWIRAIPTYRRVRYRGLYPGVDAIFYGSRGHLEYDLVLQPGAPVERIELRFPGAEQVAIDAGGALVLGTGAASLRQRPPVAYQVRDGRRVELDVRYVRRADGAVGFAVRGRARDLPLVIDPVLEYSTFVGGAMEILGLGQPDTGTGVAVDAAGDAFVVGTTTSSDFPVSPGAFQANGFPNANVEQQAFVLKLDPTGGTLIYATYLGGVTGSNGAFTGATGVAVDAAGHAFVVGTTSASDFPTVGAAQPTYGGGTLSFSGGDAFVAELAPDGGSLVYSTYLGGSGDEQGLAIAVDGTGAAYVAGATLSTDFPVAGPLATKFKGGALPDAFVAKLSPSGGMIVYSTTIGGHLQDIAYAIAVDTKGQAHVAGVTGSLNFPTKLALQPALAQSDTEDPDAFVVKLKADGSVAYATFLGGERADTARAVALDAAGNLYVTGETDSSGFPTVNALQPQLAGGGKQGNNCNLGVCTDAFVAKLSPDGQSLLYATYLGGTADDVPLGLAVDAAGHAYVAGTTGSIDFPVIAPLQAALAPGSFVDAFVARLAPDGSSLEWSTFLGGGGQDAANAIAVGPADVYVTGSTASFDWPTTPGAAQKALLGASDVFVARISNGGDPGLEVQRIAPASGGNGGQVTVIIAGAGFAGPKVKLTAAGQPDVAGEFAQVDLSGERLEVTFDLTGAAPGPRDVVVTDADGQTATLKGAFTVVAGGAPQVWADVLIRPDILLDAQTPITVTYGNTGNVDAVLMPLWIEIPKGTGWVLPTPVVHPPLPASAGHFDWSTVPKSEDEGTVTRIPLVLPRVPAGHSGSFPIDLTFDKLGVAKVTVWADPPLLTTTAPPAMVTSYPGLRPLTTPGNPKLQQASCILAEVNAVFDALDLVLPLSCGQAVLNFILGLPGPVLDWAGQGSVTTLSWAELSYSIASTALTCAEDETPAGALLSAVQLKLDAIDILQSCGPQWGSPSTTPSAAAPNNGVSTIVAAHDPNAKLGSQGAGPQRYVAGVEPLRYAVAFENEASATAAAQTVVVTDTLDANLDLDTVALGAIAAGDLEVAPAGPTQDFDGWLDARGAVSLLVKVSAHLDRPSRTITWQLTSIDPTTGMPPADPTVGFLPPNTMPPLGEGSVAFTAAALASLPTSTEIKNAASVVFDASPAIATKTISNTLDRDPPSSHVLPIASGQSASAITVKWTGTDVGSGIFDYTIFVSEDGAPATVWLRDTTETQGVYAGASGKTYAFESRARDRAGNTEAPHTSPDAQFTASSTSGGTGCGCLAAGASGEAVRGWMALAALVVCMGRRRRAPRRTGSPEPLDAPDRSG